MLASPIVAPERAHVMQRQRASESERASRTLLWSGRCEGGRAEGAGEQAARTSLGADRSTAPGPQSRQPTLSRKKRVDRGGSRGRGRGKEAVREGEREAKGAEQHHVLLPEEVRRRAAHPQLMCNVACPRPPASQRRCHQYVRLMCLPWPSRRPAGCRQLVSAAVR
eukprot:803457-Rhodomonas_salina.1